MAVEIVVKIDDPSRAFASLSRQHESSMFAALRGEAFRLKTKISQYARSRAWRYTETTKAFRKSLTYGTWFSRISRYSVNRENLSAVVGVIGRGSKYAHKNVQPVSGIYANNARNLQSGWRFRQTRARWKAMWAHLKSMKATRGRRAGQLKYTPQQFATMRLENKIVPKIGWHTVPARPVIDPVYRQERVRIVRNVLRLYDIKMSGKRFSRTWVQDWGDV